MEEFSTVHAYYEKYPKPGEIVFESTTYVNFGVKSIVRTSRQYIDKKGTPKLMEFYTSLFDFFDNLDGTTKRTQKEVDDFFNHLESYKNNYKDRFFDKNSPIGDKIYIEIDGIQYPYNNPACKEDKEYKRAMSFIEDSNPYYSLTNKMFLDMTKKWFFTLYNP